MENNWGYGWISAANTHCSDRDNRGYLPSNFCIGFAVKAPDNTLRDELAEIVDDACRLAKKHQMLTISDDTDVISQLLSVFLARLPKELDPADFPDYPLSAEALTDGYNFALAEFKKLLEIEALSNNNGSDNTTAPMPSPDLGEGKEK